MATPTPKQRTTRRAAVFIVAIAAALGVVYVGLATGGSDQVPENTTVLGRDIGGKTEVEAAAYLKRQVAKTAAAPLTLRVGKLKVVVTPAQAGLTFDANATVAEVTGTRWSPASLVRRFIGSSEVDPVVAVDEDRVRALVAGLATRVDVTPVNADVVISDGEAQLINSEPGKQVDQEASVRAIIESYLHSKKAVTLPIVETAPAVSDSEAARVLEEVAIPAINESVTIKATSKKGTVSGRYKVWSVLSFEPDGSALKPVVDGEMLKEIIGSEFGKVEQAGRDATFKIVKGKPVVVPSVIGFGINTPELAESVASVLTKSGAERTVVATMGDLIPSLTTEQAKALGVVQKMASYTQDFPYAAYRVQNIGVAAKRMNGTLLKPGEVFSMNDIIGERTVENGYTKGFVVGDGGVLKMDEGGGVSTATTAAFNAAWFAGLEFVQHRAHSIWIKRYKPGREATVSWGDFDMKFRNNTPHGVYITSSITDESVNVTIWGKKEWQKIGSEFGPMTDKVPFETLYSTDKECNAQKGQEGFKIDVDRTFYKAGKLAKKETYTTKYKPSPTVVCGPDPRVPPPPPPGESTASPAPSASPSGSASSSG